VTPETVKDLVFGHVASFQDALSLLSQEAERAVCPENVAAAQRAASQAQEALAALSVALCDADVAAPSAGQEQER
jgi:hypothetical protein